MGAAEGRAAGGAAREERRGAARRGGSRAASPSRVEQAISRASDQAEQAIKGSIAEPCVFVCAASPWGGLDNGWCRGLVRRVARMRGGGGGGGFSSDAAADGPLKWPGCARCDSDWGVYGQGAVRD
jgi:hypothetical protein